MGIMRAIFEVIGTGIAFMFEYFLFVNFFLAIIVVFFQRKDPKSTWTWLLFLYIIPVFGFIIYLLIGTDMHKRRIFRTKEIDDRLSQAIHNQRMGLRNKEALSDNETVVQYSDLILYNLETSGAILSSGNDVHIINDGKEKFDLLLADMKNAKKSIHFQYYIIRPDEVFDSICEVLRERAKAGVEVRILYDSMGSRWVRERFWRMLRSEGIEAVGFFPALLRWFHLRINYRNHRKIVVIDSHIAYVGGFNVGREYLGKDEKYGYWRDSHLRIIGEAVEALQARFILDWNHAAKKNLNMERYLKDEAENLSEIPKEFLPDNPTDFLADITTPSYGCDVQIISDGPDTHIKNIRDNYLRLISKAKKRIYIQTPYFIPDESIMSALLFAIHSGIEVNIMIPDRPDHPFVYWATYYHIGEMVTAGANCYTYRDGFMHAKVMVIDDEVASCGTANMDIRSFTLNFEVNAIIYSKEKAKELSDAFLEDVKRSRQITKDAYLSRPLKIRFKEQTCRILSPLL
ncbi:MAG: cardiolipin synthase [Lachnospiraceae bacterium]|jgi:cardiolipin synthase|nr:cardiolipin synthase [Lachnospiraceae bacterium]